MKRIEQENHARFLTFSCYNRLPLFTNDTIKDLFIDHLESTQERTNFHLLAWVIMPEHIHLLLWPKLPEFPVSKITWHLKRSFAKQVINRWRDLDAEILNQLTTPTGQTRFWQHGGGYDRNIHSPEELNEKINYIHTNPVRRGLVNNPTDWAWSSARWYAGIKDNSIPIDEPRKPI